MLELGVGADVLQAVGSLYWVLIAVLVLLALWLPQTGWQKALSVLVVLMVMVGPALKRGQEQAQQVDERKVRYEKARALFIERCKTAGEKIYRTAEEVEGILLLKVRSGKNRAANMFNPNWSDAGLPQEGFDRSYIESFMLWEGPRPKPRGALHGEQLTKEDVSGYRFVEVLKEDGLYTRYTLKSPYEYPFIVGFDISKAASQYAVTYRPIENSEDREFWVAGMVVEIFDTRTNELIAQSTWYSFEPGLGSKEGNRVPWLFAKSCPELTGAEERTPTRFFVDRVLKAKQGE